MPDVMHLIKINVAPERVYQAVTTADGIRNWWTRTAELDARIGGIGEFSFGRSIGHGVTRVRVEEQVPSRRVVWKTVDSFRPEWVGTKIEFELRSDGNQTTVLFAHRGYPQADDNYALCTTGWGYYLVSLQLYLEKGEGAPSPDVDFGIVVKAGSGQRA